MQQEDSAKLKQIELDILKQFVSVCEKLNLTYCITGGTLLGAVRHKGFIPWDDDIDVGMPRKDYNVFLQKAQELLPSHYFLQTHKTDPEYPWNFAKIRNSNTTFIESSVANRKINHGVYIDVFPFDFYPDSKWQQTWCEFQLKLLHFRMRSEVTIPKQYKPSATKRALQGLFMGLAKVVYPSVKRAIEKREELMKKYKNTSLIANFCGPWNKREILPASYFEKSTLLPFEDIQVLASTEYDKYLTYMYGNYMQLPPREEQQGHHYTTKEDLEKPYTYYVIKEN